MTGNRKKKISGYILVCVLTMAIGFLIVLQIKTTAQTGNYAGGMISLAQAQASAAELNKVKYEKEALLEELKSLEDQVKEYENSATDENSILQEKNREIEKYRMASGVTDVTGKGVSVFIDDPQAQPGVKQESIITYNYELLLVLVNKMREAEAEAISINGQRITAYTEISLAGNNININGVATAPPYEVKAIGNPTTLESTLSIRYGILYSMQNEYGLHVSLTPEEEVHIPRYSGVISFDYAQAAE
ncbi:MAG: DUF881 domain-containing protein [Bacillota bacterium]|nr:DUF881 domain-containing protein [Bacillota bacterium]